MYHSYGYQAYERNGGGVVPHGAPAPFHFVPEPFQVMRSPQLGTPQCASRGREQNWDLVIEDALTSFHAEMALGMEGWRWVVVPRGWLVRVKPWPSQSSCHFSKFHAIIIKSFK